MAKRSLLFIVLGIAIGASLGFVPPPPSGRHITFKILSTGKLYLLTEPNDVIKWKHESGHPVHIRFTNSPCNEANGSDTCSVISPSGLFNYTCTDNAGNIACTDPGIEPGGGGDGTMRINPLAVSASGLNINSLVVALQIGCDSSGNLAVLDSTGKPAPAINSGALIQWTSPLTEFSVSQIYPEKSCVGGARQGPVQWCATATTAPGKRSSAVKYHVKVSGPHACQKNKEGTFSFTLK
jgi:hypothetical protein